MWFNAGSSNYNQTNFSFVWDIYTGATPWNQQPVARTRPYPQPGTNASIFSPARILESYTQFEYMPSLTGSTGTTDSYLNYTIGIGEAYGSVITTYSGLTTLTGICLNGTLQYFELPNWRRGYTALTMSFIGNGLIGTGQFLTNSRIDTGRANYRNTKGMRCYLDDYATISFFNDKRNPNRAQKMFVNIYTKSGSTRIHTIPLPSVTGNSATWVQHIGIGPMNISNTMPIYSSNGLPQTLVPFSERDACYCVYLDLFPNVNSVSPVWSACSEVYWVVLDGNTKYTHKRFLFQNRMGQADYFTFGLASARDITTNVSTFEAPLPYNYGIGNRSVGVTDIVAQEHLTITTNWITDPESAKIEEFLTSPEIFLIDSNNQCYPYIIDTNSLVVKTQEVDKLFNYQMKVRPAFSINTQRAGRLDVISGSVALPTGGPDEPALPPTPDPQ
jgi:hypothetical protein